MTKQSKKQNVAMYKILARVKKNNSPLLDKIKQTLDRVDLEPVKTRLSGGASFYMERITGTTIYLSNGKKMIYDLSFSDLYNHDGHIPENHMVVDNYLLKVDDWAHIDDDKKFFAILSRESAKCHGTRILLDDKLHLENVPFKYSEEIRNDLLHQRNTGIIYFKCLKVIDPSGNITEFHSNISKEKILLNREAKLQMSKGDKPGEVTIKTKVRW